ncbi:MAG: hypothetical protein ABI361_08400 [Nitrososphaera sp.]|jgi:hypothetical protein
MEQVPNWEAVIHKSVRAADGQGAGIVAAVEEDAIVIESAGDRVHARYPKSIVEGFNGAEVILNKPFAELWQYVQP